MTIEQEKFIDDTADKATEAVFSVKGILQVAHRYLLYADGDISAEDIAYEIRSCLELVIKEVDRITDLLSDISFYKVAMEKLQKEGEGNANH